MQAYVSGSLTVSVEDISDFIIDTLRNQPKSLASMGCDVYVQNVCGTYAGQHGAQIVSVSDRERVTEELAAPVLDAIWNLCRVGVLRPGPTSLRNFGNTDNAGYCITAFGRGWISEHEQPAFIPTDGSRLTGLLTRRQDLFGMVYAARATDAARCFSAHAYYACCAMIGAAAESILVAAAVAKFGEAEALSTYQGNQGRKKLTDELLLTRPAWLAKEFRQHADLIGLWRDLSAHAHSSPIGEAEAFTDMRGLIKFAGFAESRWEQLTTP